MSGDYVGLNGHNLISLDEQARLIELAQGRGYEARRAMDACIRSNMALVFRVVKGEQDGSDVDDLVQEGSIGLWRAIRTHDPGKEKFKAYAVGCVQHYVRDAIASEYSFSGLEEDVASETDFGENAEAVREAVRHLPLLERFVITFHYGLHDDNPLSFRELGRAMGKSHESVRKIELSGLALLKELLIQ